MRKRAWRGRRIGRSRVANPAAGMLATALLVRLRSSGRRRERSTGSVGAYWPKRKRFRGRRSRRLVAAGSAAVPQTGFFTDIFVRDRQAGTTVLASPNGDGGEASGQSHRDGALGACPSRGRALVIEATRSSASMARIRSKSDIRVPSGAARPRAWCPLS